MHLNDEQLRAYLDHELTGTERVIAHLDVCDECRARLAAIEARTKRVSTQLAALEPRTTESARSPQLAYAQFSQRQLASRKVGFSMLNIFSSRARPLWIGLSVIVLLAVAFTLPPVQAWAGDLLAMFRVSKVVVLPVDTTRLSELGGNSLLGKEVSQLFSDSIQVTKEPGKPQTVANAAAASQAAKFTVRLPGNRSDAPQITLQGNAAFNFKVNRARGQSLLDEAGFKRYQLPASLDGALIQVDIPYGVTAAYGDCPKPDRDPSAPAQRPTNCTIVVQMPSPSVNAPADLNVGELAVIGLQFIGMNEQQAREYSKTVDWTSTLVIPIPRNKGATYKQVSVDGVTGYLIQQTDFVPEYAIVWVKNGIIYTIGGTGADATAGLAMANSLK